MEYKEMWAAVNQKPEEGEWIEVFVSDWNKDHWAFYAYIRLAQHQQDIKRINELISELNWRDGDVYVELINHSDGLKNFYHELYEMGYMTQDDVLDVKNWSRVSEVRFFA